jgi:hypothetical protein
MTLNIYKITNWINEDSFIYYSTCSSLNKILLGMYKKKNDIFKNIQDSIDKHGRNNHHIKFLQKDINKEDIVEVLGEIMMEHKPTLNMTAILSMKERKPKNLVPPKAEVKEDPEVKDPIPGISKKIKKVPKIS